MKFDVCIFIKNMYCLLLRFELTIQYVNWNFILHESTDNKYVLHNVQDSMSLIL
jgi:hypothetical protein